MLRTGSLPISTPCGVDRLDRRSERLAISRLFHQEPVRCRVLIPTPHDKNGEIADQRRGRRFIPDFLVSGVTRVLEIKGVNQRVRKSSTRLIRFEYGGSNRPMPLNRAWRSTGMALLKVRKPWWPW